MMDKTSKIYKSSLSRIKDLLEGSSGTSIFPTKQMLLSICHLVTTGETEATWIKSYYLMIIHMSF